MLYRYWMHWFADPVSSLGPGRPLFGHTPAEAISHAADLWNEGAYASALGYCVIDTEDGTVLWRQQRKRVSAGRQPGVLARIANDGDGGRWSPR